MSRDRDPGRSGIAPEQAVRRAGAGAQQRLDEQGDRPEDREFEAAAGRAEHPAIADMLLRGAESVQDADGTVHPVDRPVVALCRCEKSSRLPWCDGTHKVIPKS